MDLLYEKDDPVNDLDSSGLELTTNRTKKHKAHSPKKGLNLSHQEEI
jgi:hypothetical protein